MKPTQTAVTTAAAMATLACAALLSPMIATAATMQDQPLPTRTTVTDPGGPTRTPTAVPTSSPTRTTVTSTSTVRPTDPGTPVPPVTSTAPAPTSTSVPVPTTSAPAPTTTAPSLDSMVTLVSSNGSGCAGQNATLSFADSVASLHFPGMLAGQGGPAKPGDERKNCQVALQVKPREGYMFGIDRVEVMGSAYLADKATAKVDTNIYIQGSSANQRAEFLLEGEHSGGFSYARDFNDDSLQWTPCGGGRNINVNTAASITSAIQPDIYNWVRADEAVGTKLHLVMKKC